MENSRNILGVEPPEISVKSQRGNFATLFWGIPGKRSGEVRGGTSEGHGFGSRPNSEVKHGGAEVAESFDPGAPEARLRLRVKVPCVAL